MIQPPRVLPSNASPLNDGDHVYQASRVLQEHSGNRQQSDFSFRDDDQQKHPTSLLIENTYSISHQQQYHQPQAPQLYHPQPQHRQPWRFGPVRGGHRQPLPRSEASIRLDVERLYNHFRKCDQYIKYRNRQSKDTKGNEDQKWPDHLEKAFIRALVEWPPMGRSKWLWKGKLRGRNELICDCIQELTGEDRDRKQVSSHIQVLRPFVEKDPYIVKWLSRKDMGLQPGKYQGNAAYHTGRRMSNYPVVAPPLAAQTDVRGLPQLDPEALRRAKANLNVFEPTDFEMFVQQNVKISKEQDEIKRLHTYTRSIAAPQAPDFHVDDFLTLNRDFPLLAAMQAQRPLDCNVLDAEASLAFPTETWKGKDGSPRPGVELGIKFLCTSRHLPPMPVVSSLRDKSYRIIVHNHFYENGVCSGEHSSPSEALLEPLERDAGVETRIRFGSTFWARTLGRLAGRLLDANKDHRDEVATYLRTINAVQDIVVCSEHGQERLLVIHWKFRLSTSTQGRTTWRKLVLPMHSSLSVFTTKGEGEDPIYNFNQVSDSATSQQEHIPQQVALRSPFEYESSSGSTLSSTTWPNSYSDVSATEQQHGSIEFPMDNAFDFNPGNIHLAYDAGLGFDFDSSAFNFDATTDLAADPVIQEYSQQWYDGYANTFVEQQTVIATDSFASQPNLNEHVPAYDDYSGNFDQQLYPAAHDQAYGGAGQQEIMKDEEALAALADASFIASTLVAKPEIL